MNTSYLTTDEYKRAPTAINTSNLDYFSGISDPVAQDAELANVIARASAWLDNICELPNGLAASVNTETIPTNITRDGFIRIRPSNIPIIKLTSFQWRAYAGAGWTVVDIINAVTVYQRYFETMLWSPMFGGAFQIGGNYAYPMGSQNGYYVDPTAAANLQEIQLTVQYSYINGFPNTTLVGPYTAGVSIITVDDATGILSGTVLTIYEGGKTEKVTVLSLVGNVLTLTSPLLFAHITKVAVSAIPADVKQACILLVNYLIKERGVNSITLEGASNPKMQTYDDTKDVDMAKDMMRRYKRVV